MARKYCYEHPDRHLMAYCDLCSKPCCRDCTLEILGDYYCEPCRDRLAVESHDATVYPGAMRALIVSGVAVIVGAGFVGVLLGPYAIWRAHQASQALDRVYWMRGHWHVRAAYFLGALATSVGVITLVERL